MDVASTLNEELLSQPFNEGIDEAALLSNYRQLACGYSRTENSIAVLSDLKSDKSYIYYGGIASGLGIAEKGSEKEIDSIFEEDIFNRIHAEDLLDKHLMELQFFRFLKALPVKERANWYITSHMKMQDRTGKYLLIHHRMFYVSSCPAGNLWLALCLYNYPHGIPAHSRTDRFIVNALTGKVIGPDNRECRDILSSREKEILCLIEQGKASKEIADRLFISKNTVDRHRQNILEKLRVKNSIEACRVAKRMGLF